MVGRAGILVGTLLGHLQTIYHRGRDRGRDPVYAGYQAAEVYAGDRRRVDLSLQEDCRGADQSGCQLCLSFLIVTKEQNLLYRAGFGQAFFRV